MSQQDGAPWVLSPRHRPGQGAPALGAQAAARAGDRPASPLGAQVRQGTHGYTESFKASCQSYQSCQPAKH